jgi:glycosyltransferase involved in cell wall biosynthesis
MLVKVRRERTGMDLHNKAMELVDRIAAEPPVGFLRLPRDGETMSQQHSRIGVVTVGIPTHNRSDLLERALRSVLAQTYKNLEIIVSDDASSDDTPRQMSEFTDPRIVYLRSEENTGIARNTNKCLEHATGELLLMLNDDDELEPSAIERLSQPFRQPTNGIAPEKVALTWCPCSVQAVDRQVKWVTDAGPAVEESLDLVAGLFDGTRGPRFCGIMVRTDDARVVGGYTVRHGPIPDVGNWTQVAIRRDYVVCIPDALARYTSHNASCTGTSKAKAWQEAGEAIFEDLSGYYEKSADITRLRRLRASRRNFVCGLLITVIMQSKGRLGWAKLAVTELVRVPQYFLTPMLVRRLLVDGHKLFRRPAHSRTGSHPTQVLPDRATNQVSRVSQQPAAMAATAGKQR